MQLRSRYEAAPGYTYELYVSEDMLAYQAFQVENPSATRSFPRYPITKATRLAWANEDHLLFQAYPDIKSLSQLKEAIHRVATKEVLYLDLNVPADIFQEAFAHQKLTVDDIHHRLSSEAYHHWLEFDKDKQHYQLILATSGHLLATQEEWQLVKQLVDEVLQENGSHAEICTNEEWQMLREASISELVHYYLCIHSRDLGAHPHSTFPNRTQSTQLQLAKLPHRLNLFMGQLLKGSPLETALQVLLTFLDVRGWL